MLIPENICGLCYHPKPAGLPCKECSNRTPAGDSYDKALAPVDMLPRSAKIMLFCFKWLEELRQEGALEGIGAKIPEAGQRAIQKLEAEGFKPTDDEIAACIDELFNSGHIEDPRKRKGRN